MYKNIAVLLLLISFVIPVFAQNNQEEEEKDNKRPSWSKGLPERQKSADIKTNEFKPEIDTDIEIDRSEFGLKERPKIEIELPISEEFGVKQVDNKNQLIENSEEEMITNNDTAVQADVIPQSETQNSDLSETEAVQSEAVIVEEPPVVTDSEDVAVELTAEPQESSIDAEINQQPDSSQSNTDLNSQDNSGDELLNLSETVDNKQVSQPEELVDSANENLDDSSVSEELIVPTDATVDVEDAGATETVNSEIPTQADEKSFVWEITSRTPVTYPPRAAVNNLEGWVDVEVTINPAGEVVSAFPVKYSRGGRVFGKNAIKSVKEWQFKAPSSEGITTNLTRIYKIEFDL